VLGLNWGATAAERALPLPCDELLPGARTRCHRAVSVDAPAAVLFRRLCQLRIAPYSYDALDNFGRRSPRELTAGLEQLAAGQRFMRVFTLASFAPDDHLTLRSRRVAVTYAVRPDAGSSRLLARVLFRAPGGRFGDPLLGRPLALGDLVMMRKQLLTLKALAEQDCARGLGTRLGVHAGITSVE
jgi:hypothetical protein